MANRSLGMWLALGVGLIFAFSTTAAMADSHVRIVRLSDVQGGVQIDRSTGQGYEKATANMPLIEGMKLAAKADVPGLKMGDSETRKSVGHWCSVLES